MTMTPRPTTYGPARVRSTRARTPSRSSTWEVILSSRPDVVCVLASPDPELVDFLHGFWGVLGRYPGVPHVREDGDTVLNATFWAHSGNSLGLFRVVKDGPWPDGYWVAS